MFGISSGNPEEIPLFSLESPEEIPNKYRQFIHYQLDVTPLMTGRSHAKSSLDGLYYNLQEIENILGVLLAA